MLRTWFLTNTCYGQWLPGDARGFVGHVRDHRDDDPPDDTRITHRDPKTAYDAAMPGLERAALERMNGPPLALTFDQARVALQQFRETASHRQWSILAAAVMFNHFHLVVQVPGDPDSGKILGDFKSWATRALSKQFGRPASGTWWTQGGSKRKLPDAIAVRQVCDYVLKKQPNPLVTWSPESG